MKYELIECDKPGLKQIRALKDIPRFGVKIGDLGGYIEKEENLSQDHSCWVYGNAKISGNARVYGNARVSDNAIVSDLGRLTSQVALQTIRCSRFGNHILHHHERLPQSLPGVRAL